MLKSTKKHFAWRFPRNSAVRYIVATIVLLPILLVWRYRSGAHYLPVAVELSEEWTQQGENPKVYLTSPFGTARELNQDSANPRLYRSKDYVASPVKSICIAGSQRRSSLTSSVTLNMGSSRVGFSTRLIPSYLPGDETPTTSLPSGSFQVFGKPEPSGSLIPTPAKCLNWQGDVRLVVVCLMQSICIVGYFSFLAQIFFKRWRADCVIETFSGAACFWRNGMTFKVVTTSFSVILLLLIALHQFICVLNAFLCTRDVGEHLSGVCLLGVLAYFLVGLLAKGVVLEKNKCRRLGFVLASFALLVLIRLAVSGHWPWFQTGDYGSYWRYGGLMSVGDWGVINDGYLGRDMMAIRAFLYSFPIRVLAGDSTATLVAVNTFCLIGAAICLYRLTAPSFGPTAAFFAAGLFSLHPDILFGGHLCRHDNPAMLYLALLFALMPKIFGVLAAERGWRFWTVSSLPKIIAAGVLIGLLEAQRSYMPFLLATCALCFGGVGFSRFRAYRKRGLSLTQSLAAPLKVLIVFLIIAGSAFSVNSLISRPVRSWINVKEIYRNSGMLMSMETASDQSWESFVPFSALYTVNIPESQQSDFLRRKLLFEKVQSGEAFWTSLFRKNQTVSGTQSAIMSSGGTHQFEMFPSTYNVPFSGLKSTWGSGWYAFLLGLAVLRLLLVPVLEVRKEELFPAVFSLVFMTALLVLAEAGQQYDILLAFPLAICGARVLGWECEGIADSGDGQMKGVDGRGISRRILRLWFPGVLGLCTVIVLHLAASHVVSTNPGWTFAQPRPTGLGIKGQGETARCASALLPDVDNGLKMGDVCSVTFEVPEAELSTDSIRFFVSCDQRRNRIFPEAPFADLPLSFSVSIDGVVVETGKLKDLTHPPFVSHRYTRNAGTHLLELRMTADADIAPEKFETPVQLAVEYVH